VRSKTRILCDACLKLEKRDTKNDNENLTKEKKREKRKSAPLINVPTGESAPLNKCSSDITHSKNSKRSLINFTHTVVSDIEADNSTKLKRTGSGLTLKFEPQYDPKDSIKKINGKKSPKPMRIDNVTITRSSTPQNFDKSIILPSISETIFPLVPPSQSLTEPSPDIIHTKHLPIEKTSIEEPLDQEFDIRNKRDLVFHDYTNQISKKCKRVLDSNTATDKIQKKIKKSESSESIPNTILTTPTSVSNTLPYPNLLVTPPIVNTSLNALTIHNDTITNLNGSHLGSILQSKDLMRENGRKSNSRLYSRFVKSNANRSEEDINSAEPYKDFEIKKDLFMDFMETFVKCKACGGQLQAVEIKDILINGKNESFSIVFRCTHCCAGFAYDGSTINL